MNILVDAAFCGNLDVVQAITKLKASSSAGIRNSLDCYGASRQPDRSIVLDMQIIKEFSPYGNNMEFTTWTQDLNFSTRKGY